MKIFLLILLVTSTLSSHSQFVINRTFGTNTVNDPRLMASINLYMPRYIDTTAANLTTGVDTCGAVIFAYTDNSMYQRLCNPKRWQKILRLDDMLWTASSTLLTPISRYYVKVSAPSTTNTGFSDWPYLTTFNKSSFGVYGKEPSLDLLIDSSSQFQIGAISFRSNKLATGGPADKFPRLPAARFSANAYAVIEANAFRNGSSPWTSTVEIYLGDSTGANVNVPFAASGPGVHFFGNRTYHTAESKEAFFFATAINRVNNLSFNNLNTFFAGNLNNLPAHFLNAPSIILDSTAYKPLVLNNTALNGAMYKTSWPDVTRESVTISGAGTLNLDASSVYVFSGTTTTWTLPAVAGTSGKSYLIKNRGSGSITLNTTASANEIYSTSAVNTVTITAGSSLRLVSDGTFYLTM